MIGKLCHDQKVTIMVTTPTFLRSYMRRCTPEEFATMNLVVTGAEKLPTELLEAFEERFGVRPMEGYGTTELSPIVSVNVPPNRAVGGATDQAKIGTVGQPLPGVQARSVDLDSGQPLGVDEIRHAADQGPQRHAGLLQACPRQTAKVLRDGWYTTGDMGMVDADGFIHITGRLSRFSKIGGEMVPHIRIEELLQGALAESDDERLVVAVTVGARRPQGRTA